jgi:hypothetical protein
VGGGDGSRLGQIAIDKDTRVYGPLKMVVKGIVQNADRNPRKYARGIIDVHGCPAARGAAINVGAAPISNTEYATLIGIDEPNNVAVGGWRHSAGHPR